MPRPPLDRSPASVEKVFNAIRTLHTAYPDLRVGQIIASAVFDVRQSFDPFNIENDDLASAILKMADKLAGSVGQRHTET